MGGRRRHCGPLVWPHLDVELDGAGRHAGDPVFRPLRVGFDALHLKRNGVEERGRGRHRPSVEQTAHQGFQGVEQHFVLTRTDRSREGADGLDGTTLDFDVDRTLGSDHSLDDEMDDLLVGYLLAVGVRVRNVFLGVDREKRLTFELVELVVGLDQVDAAIEHPRPGDRRPGTRDLEGGRAQGLDRREAERKTR